MFPWVSNEKDSCLRRRSGTAGRCAMRGRSGPRGWIVVARLPNLLRTAVPPLLAAMALARCGGRSSSWGLCPPKQWHDLRLADGPDPVLPRLHPGPVPRRLYRDLAGRRATLRLQRNQLRQRSDVALRVCATRRVMARSVPRTLAAMGTASRNSLFRMRLTIRQRAISAPQSPGTTLSCRVSCRRRRSSTVG